jgi:DNA-binding transcriptional LysR family regulator
MHNLKQLITFVKVVEEQSFAGAARRLRITNAAISKQVRALEDEMKILLLNRTTRRLSLTEAGKVYYEHAKRLVYEMNEIETLFHEIRAEPKGVLKIASARHFAECYLIPYLEDFLKKYPKISFELLIVERTPNLEREGIDISVGHTYVGGQDDIHKMLTKVRYAFCASPSYLQQFGIPKSPEDLKKHRYITHSNRIPDNVLTFKNTKEVRLEPFLRIDDSRIMVECAKQGLGIVKLHHYAIKEEIQKNELVEILQEFDSTTQPIYLCYQPHRYLHPKIRHFIDFFSKKVITRSEVNSPTRLAIVRMSLPIPPLLSHKPFFTCLKYPNNDSITSDVPGAVLPKES